MDYQKKLQQYRERIKNGSPFINFLGALLEWVENLYDLKRIRREQEQEILSYYPREIWAELDTLSAEISAEDHEKLKLILLRETSELINFIISVGNLRRRDFDNLQFKLSQIFGKEEITLMLEWARLHLIQVAKEREEKSAGQREAQRIAEEEYFAKMSALPPGELKKLVVSQMFDFSPRARTPLERQEVLKKHQEKVSQQKDRFKRFEEKLLDATIESRAEAQSKVYRQIGVVKREMDTVVGEFRQKAKDFASEEGPKKEIGKAQERIAYHTEIFSRGVEEFRQKMVGKGKNWKKDFGTKIEKEKSIMLEQGEKLGKEQQQAQERIEKKGKQELQEAEQRVRAGAANFAEGVQLASTKFSEKAAEIQEQGQQEINRARTMMLKEKGEFETEVEQAQGKFSEKATELGYAQKDFIGKRDIAREKFIRRGLEIESGMYGNIYEGKKKFGRKREKAQERFMSRAEEIQGRATEHVLEKKSKFRAEKETGRKKFLGKAEEIKSGGGLKIKRPEFPGQAQFARGGKRLAGGAEVSKSQIEQQRQKMMIGAGEGRRKMQQEVQKRKELFLYDVKFAQYTIQERATQFRESIAAKQEEFKARGEQVTTRHRAHQKAHLIQNLLRMIREMH